MPAMLDNSHRFVWLVVLALGLWISVLLPVAAQVRVPGELNRYFREYVGLSDAEIKQIEKGTALAKIWETGQKPEIRVFGAVYINAPPAQFVALHRKLEERVDGEHYLAVRRISTTPDVADFSELKLDDEDIRDLRDCKPGDCMAQLPNWSVEKFRSSINWNAPDNRDQVNRLVRQLAVDGLKKYMTVGNAALGTYLDKDYPVNVAETFQALLSRFKALPAFVPEFRSYLLDYPKATLPGAEDLFYWERVHFGLKPTFRINHMIVYRASKLPTAPFLIADKQLYASHYFQTAVDLWVCAPDMASSTGKGFFLVTIKASRQHGLTGLKGSLLRGVITGRTRDSTEKGLAGMKRKLESAN
jgi:hypothetical protein